MEEAAEEGIIMKTREMGRGYMYKLNTQDARVKVLMKFDFELSSATFDQERIPVQREDSRKH